MDDDHPHLAESNQRTSQDELRSEGTKGRKRRRSLCGGFACFTAALVAIWEAIKTRLERLRRRRGLVGGPVEAAEKQRGGEWGGAQLENGKTWRRGGSTRNCSCSSFSCSSCSCDGPFGVASDSEMVRENGGHDDSLPRRMRHPRGHSPARPPEVGSRRDGGGKVLPNAESGCAGNPRSNWGLLDSPASVPGTPETGVSRVDVAVIAAEADDAADNAASNRMGSNIVRTTSSPTSRVTVGRSGKSPDSETGDAGDSGGACDACYAAGVPVATTASEARGGDLSPASSQTLTCRTCSSVEAEGESECDVEEECVHTSHRASLDEGIAENVDSLVYRRSAEDAVVDSTEDGNVEASTEVVSPPPTSRGADSRPPDLVRDLHRRLEATRKTAWSNTAVAACREDSRPALCGEGWSTARGKRSEFYRRSSPARSPLSSPLITPQRSRLRSCLRPPIRSLTSSRPACPFCARGVSSCSSSESSGSSYVVVGHDLGYCVRSLTPSP